MCTSCNKTMHHASGNPWKFSESWRSGPKNTSRALCPHHHPQPLALQLVSVAEAKRCLCRDFGIYGRQTWENCMSTRFLIALTCLLKHVALFSKTSNPKQTPLKPLCESACAETQRKSKITDLHNDSVWVKTMRQQWQPLSKGIYIYIYTDNFLHKKHPPLWTIHLQYQDIKKNWFACK